MFEYNEQLKLSSLSIFGFDIESLDINKICHVPMHQYRLSTKEQPMLYVDNLQCCIGIYAYGNNFGFSAHINPVVIRGDEYETNITGDIVRCRRIDDLKKAILSNKLLKTINIGIIIGCTPLDRDYPTIKMIYEGINNLIKDLNYMGIIVGNFEEQYVSEFILDPENGKIILSEQNKLNKTK